MGDQLVVLGVVVLDVHLKQLLVAEQLVAVLEGAANTLGQMERNCYKNAGKTFMSCYTYLSGFREIACDRSGEAVVTR